MYTFVVDADGLIKLGKAGCICALAQNDELLVPKAVYEEAVINGKRRMYRDAFDLEIALQERAQVKSASTDERADELLRTVYSLGTGEQAALHLYFASGADALISDDRAFLRLLSDNSIPFLTPTDTIAFLYKIGALGRSEALAALENIRSMVRQSSYNAALQEIDNE